MKSIKYVPALILFSIAVLAPAQVKGKITGTVIDELGIPAKYLLLRYEQLDGLWVRSGQIPETRTDENGHFSIDISVTRREDKTLDGGRWAVSPHVDLDNRNSYYIDPFNRFYHVGHAQEINVTPESPNVVVEIVLTKGGALMGKVTDAVTGALIKGYYMELDWTAEPTRGIGGSIGMGSSYRWLLPPNTEITIKVRAKGYKPQEYRDIAVGPGQDRMLDIQLQPEEK